MFKKIMQRLKCNHDYYTIGKKSYFDSANVRKVIVRKKRCRKCGKKKTFKYW